MFKGNMSKLLKQAQDVQKQIEQVQNQLSDMIIESEAGGGMVKVKVNGKQEVLELSIDKSTLEEDKEVIEDLIVSALNKALSIVLNGELKDLPILLLSPDSLDTK